MGHAYTALVTDALARHHRAAGRRVWFQTGTDEHGINVERTAAREGVTPQALADRHASAFRSAFDRLDVVPDRFVRTTSVEHGRAARALWHRLEAAGELYRARYEGWYCAPCEAYFDAADLDGDRCRVHERPCEWQSEENTFFRLSRHRDALLRLVDERDFVEPAGARAELLGLLRQPLPDVSLTRQSVRWGIPAPGLPGEVLYVFGVDALANYLTGTGWPDADAKAVAFGPATTHVIGKEILRFHGLYWPAFLLAAGLPLPGRLAVHGWLTVDGRKLSKTAGNAIDPNQLVDRYGTDPTRLGLIGAAPFGRDGDFSRSALLARWNGLAADGLGNWVQRLGALGSKLPDGVLGDAGGEPDADGRELAKAGEEASRRFAAEIERLGFDRAIDALASLVAAGARHLERTRPWAATDDAARTRSLRASVASARLAARLLAPLAPGTAARLGARLRTPLRRGPPPCPRLE